MAEEAELPMRDFDDRGTLWQPESPQNLRGLLRLVAKEADREQWVQVIRFVTLMILHKRADTLDALLLMVIEASEQRGVKGKELAITGAQALLEKGHKEGIQSGRREGYREGYREGQR